MKSGTPRLHDTYSMQSLQMPGFRWPMQCPERQAALQRHTRSTQPPLKATADLAERATMDTQGVSTDTVAAELANVQAEGVSQPSQPEPKEASSQEPKEVLNGEASSTPSTSQPASQQGQRHNTQQRPRTGSRTAGGPRTQRVVESYSFKEGDFVVGKIVRENPAQGWRIEVLSDPGVLGLCPPAYKPYTLRDTLEDFPLPEGAVGTVRMFKVERIPDVIYYNGRGPILSAGSWDHGVIWRRAQQIRDIHLETMDDLAAAEVRKAKSYITVVDVEPGKKRFIGNLVEAAQIRGLEGLQIGDLMTGVVVKVASYGAFVRMGEELSIKGLLHIRNVTQLKVEDLNRVFAVGDKLSAFLIDVDEKNQVEFSTMELETYPGEVLNDMEGVMRDAASRGTFEELHNKAVEAKQRNIEARQQARSRQSGDRYSSYDNNYNGYSQRSRSDNEPEVWRSRDDDDIKKGASLDW